MCCMPRWGDPWWNGERHAAGSISVSAFVGLCFPCLYSSFILPTAAVWTSHRGWFWTQSWLIGMTTLRSFASVYPGGCCFYWRNSETDGDMEYLWWYPIRNYSTLTSVREYFSGDMLLQPYIQWTSSPVAEGGVLIRLIFAVLNQEITATLVRPIEVARLPVKVVTVKTNLSSVFFQLIKRRNWWTL